MARELTDHPIRAQKGKIFRACVWQLRVRSSLWFALSSVRFFVGPVLLPSMPGIQHTKEHDFANRQSNDKTAVTVTWLGSEAATETFFFKFNVEGFSR